jgi:hypothetical protein
MFVAFISTGQMNRQRLGETTSLRMNHCQMKQWICRLCQCGGHHTGIASVSSTTLKYRIFAHIRRSSPAMTVRSGLLDDFRLTGYNNASAGYDATDAVRHLASTNTAAVHHSRFMPQNLPACYARAYCLRTHPYINAACCFY